MIHRREAVARLYPVSWAPSACEPRPCCYLGAGLGLLHRGLVWLQDGLPRAPWSGSHRQVPPCVRTESRTIQTENTERKMNVL